MLFGQKDGVGKTFPVIRPTNRRRVRPMETDMNHWKPIVSALALILVAVISLSASANMGAEDAAESTDPNWVEGKKAVEAQEWKRATELLSKAGAADPKNADIQNWLGFAQRKQGHLDAAFAAYNEALKLNPAHKAAHEYIGEAYLMTGNLAKAEQHLAELQKLCSPIPCEQLKDLRRAVDEYKKRKK
jgi:tetratricopeptide (TPR) repeat protein